ncbi:MAG: hypothetical protein IID57_09015 [Proteobacteria bacterium]|nr:hypothetical protein [Pseudomonadota bacterium]
MGSINDLQILVRARYDAESVYLIADLIRSGVPPSEQSLATLAAASKRLSAAVKALGGDVPPGCQP